MANQIALQLAVPRAGELLAGADAHVVSFELGAAAAIGGISTRTWSPMGAALNVDQIAAMIAPPGYPLAPTRAIAVEQIHGDGGDRNRRNGGPRGTTAGRPGGQGQGSGQDEGWAQRHQAHGSGRRPEFIAGPVRSVIHRTNRPAT